MNIFKYSFVDAKFKLSKRYCYMSNVMGRRVRFLQFTLHNTFSFLFLISNDLSVNIQIYKMYNHIIKQKYILVILLVCLKAS